MPDDFIRSCYDRQMCPLVSALTADLFAGWFSQALRGRLFEAITGRWFGTVLGVLIKLFLQFLYCLVELSDQLCLCVDCGIQGIYSCC